MKNSLDKSDFLSLFGFSEVWNNLGKTGRSTHAVIATDLDDGAIRSILLRAKKMKSGDYRIRLKYLFHAKLSDNKITNMLELNFYLEGDQVVIKAAEIEGVSIDVTDAQNVFALSRAFKTFSNHLIGNNEWINPVSVLEKEGLVSPGVGRRSWPGLYVTGDFKSVASNKNPMTHEPVYPALFLPAILGVGQESYAETKQNTQTLTIHGDERTSILKRRYKQGATSKHMNIESIVSIYTVEGTKEEKLYEVKTLPHPTKKKHALISKLQFMGRNIDLTNAQAEASVIKVIRNINRMIRAGERALVEDLKKKPQDRRFALPSELALYTSLYSHLNEKKKLPPEGLMSFTVVGGNNTKKYLSDSDLYIGANQYVVGYEREGHSPQALMIDAGVLFHEVFDTAFFNAAKFFHHKHDKSHKPEILVQAIMLTHRHKDHLGQLAYLVKAGYKLPLLILSEMGQHQLKRDLSELKVDKEIRKEILAQCYAVSLTKDINPQDPAKTKITTIAGTTIEQWTEAIEGADLDQFHYYPKLKIGDFMVRCGPMPHSDPGLMFDIITPAGSLRHTGDYKFDNTIKLDIPPLEPWLKAFKPDALSADSSGVFNHGGNPLEGDVHNSILENLESRASRRFIFPMLGSNIARLTTLIAALGDTKTERKTLIIDGKAVEDLTRDADKVFDLKKWAKDKHGIKILYHTQKEAADFIGNKSRDQEYALLVSGTQDEAYSSFARAARDWLPNHRYSISHNDTIHFLQGLIPTGDNKFKRLDVKEFVEFFHRAELLLPEVLEKESALQIKHSSGHNDRAGMVRMIALSSYPTVLPMHGGLKHLAEHQKLAIESGANAMIVKDFSAHIQRGGEVLRYKISPSELVGINVFTPKNKWYLKGRHRETILKIKPDLETPVTDLLDLFEQDARNQAGPKSEFEMANIFPISLSNTFNAQTVNGFLRQNMPFGIDKYKGHVFEQKNIHALGSFDTETGGINASEHLIREYAMTVQNLKRETIGTTQLFQKIPAHRMPALQALLVTGTDPYDLKDGLYAHEFVYEMNKAIKDVKARSHELAEKESGHKIRKNNVKALMIAHNTKFDSRMIAKENTRNLITDTRPHQTRGLIALDTRAISRALSAYVPKKYNVSKKAGSSFDDHTLEALCKNNNVQYDPKKAHGGQYDTTLCIELFWKQYDIAPDIVQQMIVNADSTTGHLMNDMMGVDTGFGGPHPVFSYVSPAAKRPGAKMGSLIGTLESERYAVVFNLQYDPNKYLHLSEKDIAALLSDYNCDVFELIDLRQQPIVVPARFGLRVKANGNTPKETIDQRAGTIKRHLDYVDPENNWQTLAQKISNVWSENRKEIFGKRISKDYPILEDSPSRVLKDVASPDKAAIELLKMNAQIGFNIVYQDIHKHIRQYLKHIQGGAYEAASHNYHILMRKRSNLGSAVDAINDVHYDIRPQDLNKEDRQRINAMRDIMAFKHYRNLEQQAKDIGSNPALYAKFIGNDTAKKTVFENTQKWLSENKHLGVLSQEAKSLLHPWASLTRSGYSQNDNAPISPDTKVA